MNAGGRKSQCGLRHAVAGTAATPATTRSETADDQDADDKRGYAPEERMDGTGRVRHGGSRECSALAAGQTLCFLRRNHCPAYLERRSNANSRGIQRW